MRYRTPFWLAADGVAKSDGFYWEASETDGLALDGMIARALAALEAGFRRIKFDLDVFTSEREVSDRGVQQRDIALIGETALRLRDALGDAVEIAFDCHWRFDVPTALEVARAIAPARPMWLEDPVPPNPAALAAVARNSPVPIATGENTYLLDGFERLIEHESAHILTPDIQKAGGLLESVRIADSAARHFLPIAPHCIASPLGFYAAVHVCAASTNVSCLEFHGGDVPFWSELVETEEPLIVDGRVRVPSAPGIGVELDLDVVERYAAPGEPLFDAEPVR
jgi:gluconate/galactonate dehydratase